MYKTLHYSLLLACACAAPLAQATEGGGSTYNPGLGTFLDGAVPPPGFYVLGYENSYSADRLNDNSGGKLPIPGFKVRANVVAPRFVWSSPIQAAGGNLVLHAILPLVDLQVSVLGVSEHRTGLGDVSAGGGIAWHFSPQLHAVAGLDLVAPTGSYDKTHLANIGRNYWSLQPTGIVSWVQPQGFNGNLKIAFSANRSNRDTGYRSGSEFIADYAAGWAFGNGWTIGAGGYVYRQLSHDELNGASLAGSKGSSQSIGPSIMYDNGRGWFITAKLEKEFSARNRTEGAQFWLKTSIPF